MKLNWNFQRGWGQGVPYPPFHQESMDIFLELHMVAFNLL